MAIMQPSLEVNSASQQEILTANKLHHANEAEVYDIHHGEIFNNYAQLNLRRVLKFCVRTLFDLLGNRELRVLDCACGTGNLSEKLLQYNVEVDALDISPEMLTVLRKKLNGLAKNRYRTIVDDIDTFVQTTPTNSYDFITFSAALHHLPSYEETFKECIRILRRPGMILVYHEPLATERIYVSSASIALRSIDRFVWKYWGKLTRRKSISQVATNKIDIALVDYHVHRGGVNPDTLQNLIEINHGEVLDYAAKSENMRHCWSAWIDNFFDLRRDNFHLVALFK
ncbi:class I SAM-dependent methyltransferase [candidate division KSB1 bacterium]|nr:class I SAM-dependent methyltransferase [candidate division KSB1 bacterium]